MLDSESTASSCSGSARPDEHLYHLGGLVLLEEIERLPTPPRVVSHTACTDTVRELVGGRVAPQIPNPVPMDTLLQGLLDILRTELAKRPHRPTPHAVGSVQERDHSGQPAA